MNFYGMGNLISLKERFKKIDLRDVDTVVDFIRNEPTYEYDINNMQTQFELLSFMQIFDDFVPDEIQDEVLDRIDEEETVLKLAQDVYSDFAVKAAMLDWLNVVSKCTNPEPLEEMFNNTVDIIEDKLLEGLCVSFYESESNTISYNDFMLSFDKTTDRKLIEADFMRLRSLFANLVQFGGMMMISFSEEVGEYPEDVIVAIGNNGSIMFVDNNDSEKIHYIVPGKDDNGRGFGIIGEDFRHLFSED